MATRHNEIGVFAGTVTLLWIVDLLVDYFDNAL
jgi:hypothetical protein